MTVTAVGFDADDTLWHSESHFAVTEQRFADLLSPWTESEEIGKRLLQRERHNLEIFGYGAKGFTLSMIETALEVSEGSLPNDEIQTIIDWGKALMTHPVELLDGARETIDCLQGRYRLLLITKGDLFHQESKIAESGLADCFDRVEILTEKSPSIYRRILDDANVDPAEFVMVGNSLRSDILPVIEIGGQAVYIPYGITWGHERVDTSEHEITWGEVASISDVPALLPRLSSDR